MARALDDDPTNSPRFELAAYSVQKLFLAPDEYVVPPTAPYCFPLADYRAHVDDTARETFPRTRCVYGVLSYWLEDVTTITEANRSGWLHGWHGHAFDSELYDRDPAYRDSLAHMNLLTYLIGHGDTHARNFVIARSGTHTVYSVDNSKSFTLPPNRRIRPKHNWSAIQVPSLPRIAIERLRGADLSTLAVIAVLQPGDDRLVTRAAAPPAHVSGVHWTDARLVVGLTAAEIAGLRMRIDELLRRVDRNELALY